MHQETLLYMWHRLPLDQKHSPPGYRPRVSGSPPSHEWIEVPGGCVTLGVERGSIRFGWDNEFPSASAAVERVCDRATRRDERTLSRVRRVGRLSTGASGGRRRIGGGCRPSASVTRSSGSARTACGCGGRCSTASRCRCPGRCTSARPKRRRTRGGAAHGCRLRPNSSAPPTGRPRANGVFPWGDAEPTPSEGVFDFTSWDPEPAGSHPTGSSAWGVEDLAGNGWEWTARRSHRFPASARWRRTRSIRAISSTVSTSS